MCESVPPNFRKSQNWRLCDSCFVNRRGELCDSVCIHCKRYFHSSDWESQSRDWIEFDQKAQKYSEEYCSDSGKCVRCEVLSAQIRLEEQVLHSFRHPLVDSTTSTQVESPGIPPIPVEGLPLGWTEEQWGFYGAQWLAKQSASSPARMVPYPKIGVKKSEEKLKILRDQYDNRRRDTTIPY